MLSDSIRAKYRPTIGIECHVQLKTRTKLFAAGGNDARQAPPNTLVSHICFGLPGALPVLNEEAVHLAARAAFALGTEPQKFSKFDRKHYFYPDLPKGYQISQYDQPIISGGSVTIEVDGQPKTVRLNRAHLEEDAGKNTHPAGADYSLVDLNRAGTPLLEIVSEPDMHSAAEAKAYVRELYFLMKYADVSDADLYHGNMRFDVNVSVSPNDELGTRTETKNLNSFRAVEKAVEYEINRQIELLEKGEKIAQETRGWDDAKQKTVSQRGKEEAHDYRYMPDPDIPPITLDDAYIKKVASKMPTLPAEWRDHLSVLGFDSQTIETILEKGADDSNYIKELDEFLKKDAKLTKFIIKFQINDLPALEKAVTDQVTTGQEDSVTSTRKTLSFEQYKVIFSLTESGKLNSTKAKRLIFTLMGIIVQDPEVDIEKFAKDHGFIQVSDEGEIAQIVGQVLNENAKATEDVKNGEMKAIGFLVGQVMAKSKGKANPQLAQDLIKKQLGL